MSRRTTIDTNGVVIAVTAGAAVAVLFFLALSWISTPAGFGPTLAGMEEKAAKAEGLFRGGNASAFDAEAVCEDAADVAADRLKSRVQTAAQNAGVTLGNVAAGPSTGAAPVGLGAVSLQFQANGRYDQVMALLAQLSNSRPEIFVDTADLTSKTSSVDVAFQGRVFCSTAAH